MLPLRRFDSIGGKVMDALLLGIYILIWPAISLAVLVLIVSVTLKEFRVAREKGRDVV